MSSPDALDFRTLCQAQARVRRQRAVSAPWEQYQFTSVYHSPNAVWRDHSTGYSTEGERRENYAVMTAYMSSFLFDSYFPAHLGRIRRFLTFSLPSLIWIFLRLRGLSIGLGRGGGGRDRLQTSPRRRRRRRSSPCLPPSRCCCSRCRRGCGCCSCWCCVRKTRTSLCSRTPSPPPPPPSQHITH